MIRLNDMQPQPTIFTELEKINPDMKLFVVIGSGSEIDDLYLAMYGDRYTIDDMDSVKTAKYISMLYGTKWDNVYTLFQTTNDLLPNLGKQDIKTTTKQYKYTDIIKDVDSLPTYDDTELAIDNQNDRQLTHNEYTDDNINKTIVENDDKDITNFNRSYEYLKKNWLIGTIFYDVNYFVTLKIHD